MSETLDLVTRLREHLAEDERMALAASESGGPVWPNSDSETRTPQLEHARRRHDPARVLREIESKRRIISEHYPVDPCDAHDPELRRVPCGTLRALLMPYEEDDR